MTPPAIDTSEAHALALDAADPLARFRSRFALPPGAIYMLGNSLGPVTADAESSVRRALDDWKRLGVDGWSHADPAWVGLGESIGARAATLVGALPGEVVATGTTTVNIHSILSTFYRPSGSRDRILADELNFPSDLYAIQGHLSMRGLDPADHLVLARSPDGLTLDEGRIVDLMTDDVALVHLPSVLYRSGQLLDVERLARAARDRGIPISVDCCHSVGAVAHRLHDWGVDCAVWCSYKYLNAGPGSTAFLFVHDMHKGLAPLLSGWFGFEKARQFDMLPVFEPEIGASGWQVSSPGILGAAALDGSLSITLEAGIDAIRAKSLALTSYLMGLVDAAFPGPDAPVAMGTPRDPARRGGHVAIVAGPHARRTFDALRASGVAADFRPPDVIRIAPSALFNTFHEVWTVARRLRAAFDSLAVD